MRNLTLLSVAVIVSLLIACGGIENPSNPNAKKSTTTEKKEPASYDPNRGLGKFDNVEVGANLDAKMAIAGEQVASVKCLSCHKLTNERLVGPGWKGVSERRTPTWLMNFFTNPDPMIDVDPALQEQLELCLVRMPNQDLSDDEARHILEFMRKNDGVQ